MVFLVIWFSTHGLATHGLLHCSIIYVSLVIRLFDTWNLSAIIVFTKVTDFSRGLTFKISSGERIQSPDGYSIYLYRFYEFKRQGTNSNKIIK